MIDLRYQATPTLIDTLSVDVTLREGHGRTAETTDHPIEKGADITDHVRKKPRTYTIEGYVTNTPLTGTPDGGIAQATYDALDALVGRVVTVKTRFKTYQNMVLTQLDVPRDRGTGEGLHFTGSFKQIGYVSNLVTVVEVARTKQKLGPQVAKPAPPSVEDRAKKWLTFKGGEQETSFAWDALNP